MKFTWLLIMLLPCAALATPLSLERTDQLMAGKMATDKALASLKLSWQQEAQHLTQLTQSYQAEKTLLQSKLDSADTESDQASVKREVLGAQQAEAEQTTEQYQQLLTQGLEVLRLTWSQLPAPLQRAQLKEYRQLNNDSAELTQRLTALVNIMAAIKDFNQLFTLDKQLLNLNGQQWQADVLYIGLSVALFKLPDGSAAGVGHPSDKQWHWQPKPEMKSEINQAFAVYLKQQKPQLVDLPVLVNLEAMQ
ncbi:DUF3450 family protein [Shewanella intestini]|uniref:DUF3450 domain-containing protein n=1 Tax=Shewanella intestini TaxID=2017544 RepID=A0ABS5I058_9GAMM|nr:MULTISPECIES: DUF3450 family protein [Shewanella]MBR9727392.1 DUF3450 domain-containing protein [Shewanella intestini]